ncbi:hypothetical protein [Gordonia polyisoprenivorans]|uniref:hypothetical protein n=1 Tax=Gordonia polyisoprenivorans TaxID=84595 RepID=UPI001AD6EFC0|nr:hypothetical protein [Gordonia polyisoprenivorans]QTI71698.1 hypothetical protein J6U32_14575 [Gordonia polyisoprenivorans]
MVAETLRASSVSVVRIARFTAVMFKPQYLLFGVLWVLAAEGTAARLSEVRWDLGPATVVRVVVVVLVLLFLRMVDEQKDLDYDRVYHPGRPLVTGAVTAADLRVAMLVLGVVVVVLSGMASAGSAIAIAAVLAYGLGLWAAETLWPALRRSVLGNLAVTYPVQLVLAAYVIGSAVDTGQVGATWSTAWVAVLMAGSFLQFEFARKISRRPRPGEMYYSNPLGAAGAVGVSMGFVALTTVAVLVIWTPWRFGVVSALFGWTAVVLAVVPVGATAVWLRSRHEDYPPTPAAVYVLSVYLAVIGAALATPTG